MIIRREYPKEKAIGKNGSITSTKGGGMREASIRCGKGICHYYDSTYQSNCSKHTDRRLCSYSNKQRRKAKYHSKKRAETEIRY